MVFLRCIFALFSTLFFFFLEIPAATFGHNDITSSIATFEIPDEIKASGEIDLSMYIRTRQHNALIFYIGPNSLTTDNAIILKIESGQIILRYGSSKILSFAQVALLVNDGQQHLLRVEYSTESLKLTVDDHEVEDSLSEPDRLSPEVMHLGNLPPSNLRFVHDNYCLLSFVLPEGAGVCIMTKNVIVFFKGIRMAMFSAIMILIWCANI